ncbi:hypothetical protein G5B40_11570 [Pikeienuella piscinae]|uniref:Contractile injection system tube protein N-terminal domain-containing protein n=1 Tax=Pikeienuella piscinae TaxID=2748098 RepID=A0A7L5C1K9_9RHOB|nr:hypothetical protein [Pikeienuella piscinae]QIE56034.1 hypothetical protein G5B40_11570 [Pikeienuella piscinae]
MDGALVKLTIIPFETSKTFADGPPSGPPFIAQFNPSDYSDAVELELNSDETPQGADGNEAKFKSIKPRSFTFKLFLDGSGATSATPLPSPAPSSPLSVLGQIELFRATVGFYGNVHRQRFLQLVWGRLFVTCALESFSINYKLFDAAGLPIRAELDATFKEHKDAEVSALEKNLASPDIAHAHLALDGERLPNIVNAVYRDPTRYVAVAAVNRLNNLRRLPAGAELRLPPVRSADAV